jgi:hypothetical protein
MPKVGDMTLQKIELLRGGTPKKRGKKIKHKQTPKLTAVNDV